MKYGWQCGLEVWTTVWDDRLLCLQSRLAKGTIACETRFGVASECFVPPRFLRWPQWLREQVLAAGARTAAELPPAPSPLASAAPLSAAGAPSPEPSSARLKTPLFAPRSALASTTVAAANTRWKHVPVTLRCMSHESVTLRRLRLLRARPWCRVRRPTPRCRAMLSCWLPRCASTLRAAARKSARTSAVLR